MSRLAAGGAIGALFKFGEGGLGIWTQSIEGAARAGNWLVYFGSNLLPALVAVGYIVGINIAVLVFLGGALNWLVAVPVHSALQPWPEGTEALDRAAELWRTRTRYIGVGAMVVGGLWALLRLRASLSAGIRSGFRAYGAGGEGGAAALPRTERDAPMPWVALTLAVSVVPLYFVFRHVTGSAGVALVMAAIMLVAGFLFSAVASYMAGLVGSSNNPISGVTIATLLVSALLLLALGMDRAAGPAAAIMIGAVICCAAAIGGDVMQDLKAGQIVGATPWKQQVMEAVGVVAAAFAVAPILSLLLHAYGIVEPPASNPGATPLAAPQATLMASVAQGVFDRNLPWDMVAAGAAAAVVIIAIDLMLEARSAAFRMPVLAVAVGIYLPLELSTAILAGGLVALAAAARRRRASGGDGNGAARNGLLFAAGLITGEAILGILLAVPIVLFAGRNPMDVSGSGWGVALHLPSAWPGAVLLLGVIAALFRAATRSRPS